MTAQPVRPSHPAIPARPPAQSAQPSLPEQYRALLASGQAGWARCAHCGRAHFYPRPLCPSCLSDAVRIEPVTTTFRIRSFTWVHRPQRQPAGELPVLLIAGEAEGITIIAEGTGWAGQACQIGVPARLVVSDDERGVPVFAPASETLHR